jgi:hypothetical protein
MRWSDWLHARVGRTDGIALVRLMELLFNFLTADLKLEPRRVADCLWRDYRNGGRHDKPAFLKDFLSADPLATVRPRRGAAVKRQARHLNRI